MHLVENAAAPWLAYVHRPSKTRLLILMLTPLFAPKLVGIGFYWSISSDFAKKLACFGLAGRMPKVLPG